VVNRGGHYFVGNRCARVLTDVGVFPADAILPYEGGGDFSLASWHAVSSPPVVAEFELFAETQPGVNVEYDDGTRPLTDRALVAAWDNEGRGYAQIVILSDIADGHVSGSSGGGWEGGSSWEEYQAIPDSVYGC
jgi:hypothetical protein